MRAGTRPLFGTSDDPGIPNKRRFSAGSLGRSELGLSAEVIHPLTGPTGSDPSRVGRGRRLRREGYRIGAGDSESWLNGYHRIKLVG